MTCPACGLSSFSLLHENVHDFEHAVPGEINFEICSYCGLVLQDPQPTRVSLLSAYPADYRAHALGRKASGLALILRRIKQIQANLLVSRLSKFLPADRNAKILDLGCGGGHILYALRRRGYLQLTGLDQDSSLSRDFEGSTIRYTARDIETIENIEGPYDVIIMVNVIEHFLEPKRILSICCKSLLPEGKILIITPNASALSHKVFGAFWSGLHAPRHTLIFNPANFRQLASRQGLTEIYSVTLPDPGSWAISFQNWVRHFRKRKGVLATGTAWYSIALLPFWQLLATVENILGRGSSFLSALSLNAPKRSNQE
jgi:SAM-dependent methyltransferase